MIKEKRIAILVVFLIICSLFMPLSINYTAQNSIFTSRKLERYVSLSRLDGFKANKIFFDDKSDVGFELTYNLGIKEGVVNGVVLVGNCARNTILGTLIDYLNGFDYKTSAMKIVWLFLGIFLELIKNALFSIFEMAFVFFILLTQSTSAYMYILSYTLTVLLIIGLIKAFTD